MRKAGLIAILILSGCMGSPGIRPLRPLEIATARYREVDTAEMTGSLMYEGGCLLFHDDQTRALLMPVWPAGSTFNGTALIFHDPGKTDQRVVIDEEVVIGGEPLGWDAVAAAGYQPLQRQCGEFAPFFVSAVRPAN